MDTFVNDYVYFIPYENYIQYVIKNQIVTFCVEYYKQISSKNDSYLNEIIVRLFKSPFQVNLINQLFLNCIGINQQILTPEPLYSLKYAQNFIHSNKNCSNSL